MIFSRPTRLSYCSDIPPNAFEGPLLYSACYRGWRVYAPSAGEYRSHNEVEVLDRSSLMLMASKMLLCWCRRNVAQRTDTGNKRAQIWKRTRRQRQGSVAARNPHFLPICSTINRSATNTSRAILHPAAVSPEKARRRLWLWLWLWLWRRLRVPSSSRFRRRRNQGYRIKLTAWAFAAECGIDSPSAVAKGIEQQQWLQCRRRHRQR